MMCTLLWSCENGAFGQMFSVNRFLCPMRGLELITVTGERILGGSGPIFECFQQLLYIAFYCSGMENQYKLQRRTVLYANWEPFKGQWNHNDLSSESTKPFRTFTDKSCSKYCANMMAVYTIENTPVEKHVHIILHIISPSYR